MFWHGSPVRIPLPPPRPKRRWLIWLPVALAVLLPLGYVHLSPIQTIPALVAFLMLIGLNAIEHFPFHDAMAKRRLRFVAVLLLPPLAAWILGPLGPLTQRLASLATEQLLQLQDACLVGAVLLPPGLSIAMRGGRRFTWAIGIIGLVVTFLIVTVNTALIDPGS